MDSDEEDWQKPLDTSGSDTCLIAVSPSSIPRSNQSCSSKCSHSRVIIHIDIDCFYAQVEMLRNPELRDKPLGIQQKYIIVTCNYLARNRGLTKMMTVKDAKSKCPELVLVCGEDLTHYRNMSYKISRYLQSFCPLVERLGFDENFLDITTLVDDRMQQNHLNGAVCLDDVSGHLFADQAVDDTCDCGCTQRLVMGSQIAAEIRAGLQSEFGITCCAGIAHNKLLAKLVAGCFKPNQQTVLLPCHAGQLLSKLESVRQIPGIGHATAKKLQELGIVTVNDMQVADSCLIEEVFGNVAMETIKNLCQGVDDSPVVVFGPPQTVSDEDSFKKCSTLAEAQVKISQLLHSLLKRLVEDGRIPHTLRLCIRRMSETNRYSNRESRQCPIPGNVFNPIFYRNYPTGSIKIGDSSIRSIHQDVKSSTVFSHHPDKCSFYKARKQVSDRYR